MAEQLTLNQWVDSSSLSGLTTAATTTVAAFAQVVAGWQ
jgi:hypothetical protein